MPLIPFNEENKTLFLLSGGFCVHCGGKRDSPYEVHCDLHIYDGGCEAWVDWSKYAPK